MRSDILGVVLAGGSSSRFGTPKSLARVGGRALVARVTDALHAVLDDVVVLANDPAIAAAVDGPVAADEVPGLGPLGGIVTALRRAAREGRSGALCVAGDMPFVEAELLRLILDDARTHPGEIVAPEGGRRGIEPLCAYYPVAALPTAEAALAAGERAPYRLIERVPARTIPIERVRAIGSPEVLFFNVNTREDLDRAERIAEG
jgi:molybdopterin-guanine dinucleotide biosynthesis protein A